MADDGHDGPTGTEVVGDGLNGQDGGDHGAIKGGPPRRGGLGRAVGPRIPVAPRGSGDGDDGVQMPGELRPDVGQADRVGGIAHDGVDLEFLGDQLEFISGRTTDHHPVTGGAEWGDLVWVSDGNLPVCIGRYQGGKVQPERVFNL